MEQVNKVLEKFQQSKSIFRQLGLLILLILAFGAYLDFQKKSDMEQYIEAYQAYQQQVQATLRTNDSLKKVIETRSEAARKDSIRAARRTAEINKLKDSLGTTQDDKSRLEHEIDSLRGIAPDTSEISLKKDTVIALLRQDSVVTHNLVEQYELRDLDRIQEIGKHKQNTSDAITRAEAAEQRLRELPDAPKDPDKWFFGLLPKPSRTIVAVVSATVAVVTTVVVLK